MSALPSAATTLILAKLAAHAAVHPAYGFHRDELLYLAMADRLALFGMQFPPFIALAGRVARLFFGASEVGVRLLPALASTALLLLTMRLAAALGGRSAAQALAGLAFLVAPVFLRAGTLFQPVVFEQLWWTAAVYALVRLLDDADRRWWLGLGGAVGLGLLTKFSVVFLLAGLCAAVLASPLRDHLRTRWPWLGLLAAATLGLPSLLGQIAWDWPFLDQAAALRASQLERTSRLGLFSGQILMVGVAAPLMVVGLAALLIGRGWRRFRPLAWLYLVVAALLLLLRGKEYYLAPLAPLLLAVGAVAALRALDRLARVPRLVAATAGTMALVLGGLLALPLGVPVLPPERMARYAAAAGVTRAVRTNRGELLPLPQDYADMVGWDELVEAAGRVYLALPEEERARAVLLAGNYGEAGALQLLGPRLGLPRPISPAGDFHGWGPGPLPGAVAVTVGVPPGRLARLYASCEERARFSPRWVVPEERSLPILLCRRPFRPLREVWSELGPVWS